MSFFSRFRVRMHTRCCRSKVLTVIYNLSCCSTTHSSSYGHKAMLNNHKTINWSFLKLFNSVHFSLGLLSTVINYNCGTCTWCILYLLPFLYRMAQSSVIGKQGFSVFQVPGSEKLYCSLPKNVYVCTWDKDLSNCLLN